MKSQEHLFIENSIEYKETIENYDKVTSDCNKFCGMSFYNKSNFDNYRCSHLQKKDFFLYEKDDLISWGKEFLNTIRSTSNNIIYNRGIFITKNKDVKIITEKNEFKKTQQCNFFILEIEYCYNGQIFQKFFSKGAAHSEKENWWKSLNKDKILEHIGSESDFFNAKEFKHDIYDIFLSSYASGILMHEVFGHILEKDNLDVNRDLIDKLATIKMNSDINIEDNPFSSKHIYYDEIDDSGELTKKTNIITEGNLSDEVLSGVRVSNKRRNHYNDPLQYRVSNTILGNGKESHSDVFSSIKSGIYIKNIDQCFCDPINGKVILPVIEAYIIENGRKKNYIRPFTIISDVLHIANSIVAICDNYEESSIICGKMGNNISVGVGSPAIFLSKIAI